MEANEQTERGQVGIGTLIVFIAMVLVAAIAAGVLINTAGFLQSQSEETGEQSSQQVTDRVQVITETGLVQGGNVGLIQLNVKKAPGAGDIDVSEATIQYIGPNGASDITSSDSAWSLSAISGSTSVLSSDSDLFNLSMDLDQSPISNELSAGDSVDMEITTASGGSTTVTITVPDSISGESAVDL
ncbi:MAG: archaellin/type IV pilin N-terminal domain-containing protein [Salinirussus sp.]